ncbi:MAG: sugar phosphate isomerase/epimerase family protein [Candidatus Bathyarchaeia archaeon]
MNQDTLRTTPTEAFLRISKQAGFGAVEFTMDKIEAALENGTVAGIKALVQEQGIETVSINGPENFNLLGKREFSELLNRTGKVVDTANQLNCNLLIPVPSPARKSMSTEDTISQTADALEELADYCGNNIKLGLEFLGMRECSINNLQAAIETIKQVGRANVGLVLDSFHMHISDSRFSDISQLKRDQVFLAHVNDSERGEKNKLTDANRLYPGEGDIDLTVFTTSLKNIGYDGFLSLELLRPEYWGQDPLLVAKTGRGSLRRACGV